MLHALDSPARGTMAEITTVPPPCPRCGATMRLVEIFHHPRFPRVEIVGFKCACGADDHRVVPLTV